MEVLALVAVVAVCASLGWAATKIEPHIVSKDGRRFLCMGQTMTTRGEPVGRARETRVSVQADGQLRVEQQAFLRRTTSFWQVEDRAPQPGARKAGFLLRGLDDDGVATLLALRMPADSRAVAAMDALLRPDRQSSEASPGG